MALGHQHHAHSLSRHRAGVAGPGRRPARLPVRAAADGAAADPGQRRQADRAARPASAPRCCRTFRPRRSRGSTDFEVLSWNALFLPKGTPEPIVRRLNAAMSQALDTPWVRERLEKLGLEVSRAGRSARRSISRRSSTARSRNGRRRSRRAASRSSDATFGATSRGLTDAAGGQVSAQSQQEESSMFRSHHRRAGRPCRAEPQLRPRRTIRPGRSPW